MEDRVLDACVDQWADQGGPGTSRGQIAPEPNVVGPGPKVMDPAQRFFIQTPLSAVLARR